VIDDCPYLSCTSINAWYRYESKPLFTEMPACDGTWSPIPEPIPPGRYGLVFTAVVTWPGLEMTVLDHERVVAVVRYPETRNWECVPPKAEPVS
jgi:hypothetical protein